MNYDYPVPYGGKMAKTYLWQMEQDASRLRKQLNDGDALPGWVNAYIYTSADRLQAASRYMDYAVQSGSGGFTPSKASYGEYNYGIKEEVTSKAGPFLLLGAAMLGALYMFGASLTVPR